MITTSELIRAVRDHAEKNYVKEGWDFLVECWSDDDIVKVMGKVRSAKSAIAACKRELHILDDQREEQIAMKDW
jgi:hypothetical protein